MLNFILVFSSKRLGETFSDDKLLKVGYVSGKSKEAHEFCLLKSGLIQKEIEGCERKANGWQLL